MCKRNYRAKQANLVYNETMIDEIETLYLEEDLEATDIALRMGYDVKIIKRLMAKHGIAKKPKVYKVSKFNKWNFKQDNVENPQW